MANGFSKTYEGSRDAKWALILPYNLLFNIYKTLHNSKSIWKNNFPSGFTNYWELYILTCKEALCLVLWF